MTDPVPSKDRVSELIEQWGAYKQWLESGGREIEHSTAYAMTGDTIAALKDVVRLREDCRRWENARNVWMAEEKRLKAQVSRLKGYICVTALAGYRCAACAARLTAQPSKPAHEREMPHCSTCSCPPYPAPEPKPVPLTWETFWQKVREVNWTPSPDDLRKILNATVINGADTSAPACVTPEHGGRIMTLAECFEAEGGIPFVGMEANTDPLTHQEIFSAVLHHANEIVRLTAAVPAQCSPQPPGDGQCG